MGTEELQLNETFKTKRQKKKMLNRDVQYSQPQTHSIQEYDELTDLHGTKKKVVLA